MSLMRTTRLWSRSESSCSHAELERGLNELGEGWSLLASSRAATTAEAAEAVESTNDYVLVGPAGLFVIDVHHMPGPISVRNDILRHGERSQAWRVGEVVRAATALAEHLPVDYRPDVYPMLILLRGDPLLCRSGGALVSSPRVGVAALGQSPVVWTQEQVDYVAAVITSVFAGELEGIPEIRRPRRPNSIPLQRLTGLGQLPPRKGRHRR
jgi:hypothetical protein